MEIVGVSTDAVDKQKAFVDKQKLTVSPACPSRLTDASRLTRPSTQYPVLSDAKGEARKAYHVGKGLFGLAETARTTFVIDSQGTVK